MAGKDYPTILRAQGITRNADPATVARDCILRVLPPRYLHAYSNMSISDQSY